jgi:hypothetical protein
MARIFFCLFTLFVSIGFPEGCSLLCVTLNMKVAVEPFSFFHPVVDEEQNQSNGKN